MLFNFLVFDRSGAFCILCFSFILLTEVMYVFCTFRRSAFYILGWGGVFCIFGWGVFYAFDRGDVFCIFGWGVFLSFWQRWCILYFWVRCFLCLDRGDVFCIFGWGVFYVFDRGDVFCIFGRGKSIETSLPFTRPATPHFPHLAQISTGEVRTTNRFVFQYFFYINLC